jgi:hypothetical protein
MKPRIKRVYTPETIYDRIVKMAVERGKLADLLMDDPQRLSHRALRSILRVLERSPISKAVMAIRPVRSVFLRILVRGAKTASGQMRDLLQ